MVIWVNQFTLKGIHSGHLKNLNVLHKFKEECAESVAEAISATFEDWVGKEVRLITPSNPNFGELSTSMAHEIARQQPKSPEQIATQICAAIKIKQGSLVQSVEHVAGYVNFRLDYGRASHLILDTVLSENEDYGLVKAETPNAIAVEHTSANPSGPLTMGHARNTILGDAMARILSARGHSIKRRFYVNDAGRQVSILAYGFRLINEPTPDQKPDTWLGRLYACTNCALQIETAKRKLSSSPTQDERNDLQRNLDEWAGIATELESTNKDLLTKVIDAVRSQNDPEAVVQEIGRKYESNDAETVRLVKKVVDLCLDGINGTLAEMGIKFDVWDWESQLLWTGQVDKVLHLLTQLPFTTTAGASATLDINAIVEAYSLRDSFRLSETYEVPSLTLVRSDGTTLYPIRDIAYTLFKFKESNKVVNVIASEQTLPQLQIRLALYAMGEREAAKNLFHYAYGLVELPGEKMSKRRARYIALDDVIEQARRRVAEAMAERTGEFNDNEITHIVHSVALGAIKFAMLNVNSMKNLTFTWDRVLSLEQNSAPFINYAYTRAGSILRKIKATDEKSDPSNLTHPLEHLLLYKIAEMPDIFCEAADQMKPEDLANYANSIAEKFHEYYEKVDVIHADEHVKNARAMLVRAIQIVLNNSMTLLGITLTERM